MGPGEFDYAITHDGDGRVPHALGLLPDVPAYYVDESHGSLPRNDEVLAAVDELLEHGRTAILPDRPILARGIRPEGSRWRRPAVDQAREDLLKALSERAGEEEGFRGRRACRGGGHHGVDRGPGPGRPGSSVCRGEDEEGAGKREARPPSHRGGERGRDPGGGTRRRRRPLQGERAGERRGGDRQGAGLLDLPGRQAGDHRRRPGGDLLHPRDGKPDRRQGGAPGRDGGGGPVHQGTTSAT